MPTSKGGELVAFNPALCISRHHHPYRPAPYFSGLYAWESEPGAEPWPEDQMQAPPLPPDGHNGLLQQGGGGGDALEGEDGSGTPTPTQGRLHVVAYIHYEQLLPLTTGVIPVPQMLPLPRMPCWEGGGSSLQQAAAAAGGDSAEPPSERDNSGAQVPAAVVKNDTSAAVTPLPVAAAGASSLAMAAAWDPSRPPAAYLHVDWSQLGGPDCRRRRGSAWVALYAQVWAGVGRFGTVHTDCDVHTYVCLCSSCLGRAVHAGAGRCGGVQLWQCPHS